MKETACTFVWQSFFIFMPIYSICIDSTTIMFIAMESVYYVTNKNDYQKPKILKLTKGDK